MKNSIIFVGSFLLLILISTCGHMSDDPPYYTSYPLEVGNEWHYTGIITRSESYPEPIGAEPGFDDTVFTIARVLGVEILRDTIETIAMGASGGGDPEVLSFIHYYQSTDDGLYIVAYENAGGHIIHPKKSKYAAIEFKSHRFSNIFELSKFMEQSLPVNKSSVDSIIYEDPPVLTLKYPLTINSQWTYRYDHNPWRIDKRVVGKKDIHLDIGTFDCYHIKWIFDFDHDGEWDEDIWIDEYLSDKGMIKRTFSYIGVNYTDENGNPVESFNMTQEYTLTEIYY